MRRERMRILSKVTRHNRRRIWSRGLFSSYKRRRRDHHSHPPESSSYFRDERFSPTENVRIFSRDLPRKFLQIYSPVVHRLAAGRHGAGRSRRAGIRMKWCAGKKRDSFLVRLAVCDRKRAFPPDRVRASRVVSRPIQEQTYTRSIAR